MNSSLNQCLSRIVYLLLFWPWHWNDLDIEMTAFIIKLSSVHDVWQFEMFTVQLRLELRWSNVSLVVFLHPFDQWPLPLTLTFSWTWPPDQSFLNAEYKKNETWVDQVDLCQNDIGFRRFLPSFCPGIVTLITFDLDMTLIPVTLSFESTQTLGIWLTFALCPVLVGSTWLDFGWFLPSFVKYVCIIGNLHVITSLTFKLGSMTLKLGQGQIHSSVKA